MQLLKWPLNMVPALDNSGAWSRLDVGSPGKLPSPSRSVASSRRSDVSSRGGSNVKHNGYPNGSKSNGAPKQRTNGVANRPPSQADSDADSYKRASLTLASTTLPPEQALLARSLSDSSVQPKQRSPPPESARSYVSSYVESETSSVRAGKAPKEKTGKRHVHASRPGLGHHGGGKRRQESEMLNVEDLKARDQSPSRKVQGRCICEICTCEHCSCAAHAPQPAKKITPFVGISRHEETYRPFTDQEKEDSAHKKCSKHAHAESASCPWNKGARFEGEAQSRSAFKAPPPEARPQSYKELFPVDPRAETDTRRTTDEIAKHKFIGGTVYQDCFVEQPMKSNQKLASKMKSKMTGSGKVQGPWGIQTAWKQEGTTATRSAHRDFTKDEYKNSKPPPGVDLRFNSEDSPWKYQSDKGFYQGNSTAKQDFQAFSKEELMKSPDHAAECKAKRKVKDSHAWVPESASNKDLMVTTYGREFKEKRKEADTGHGKTAPVRDFWSAYEGQHRDGDDNHQALWFAGRTKPKQEQRTETHAQHRAFTAEEQKEGRPCATRSLRMESPNGPFEVHKGASMEKKTVNQNDFAPPPRDSYGHIGADKKGPKGHDENPLEQQRGKETRDFQTTSRGTHDKPQKHHCPAKKLLRDNPPPAPPAGREHIYYDDMANVWY